MDDKYEYFMKQLRKECIIPQRSDIEYKYLSNYTEMKNLVDVLGNGNCWIYSLLLCNEKISLQFFQYYRKQNKINEGGNFHINPGDISYFFRHFLMKKSVIKENEKKSLYKSSIYKDIINYSSWKVMYEQMLKSFVPWKKKTERDCYNSYQSTNIVKCCMYEDYVMVFQFIAYVFRVSFQVNIIFQNIIKGLYQSIIFKKSGSMEKYNINLKNKKFLKSVTYPTLLFYPSYTEEKNNESILYHMNVYTDDVKNTLVESSVKYKGKEYKFVPMQSDDNYVVTRSRYNSHKYHLSARERKSTSGGISINRSDRPVVNSGEKGIGKRRKKSAPVK